MNYRVDLLKRTDRIREIFVLLILAGLTWATHFWRCFEFGLYEDDFTFVSSVLDLPLTVLMRQLSNHFLSFAQGRPICFSLINSLSYLGNKIGGLNAIYVIGYFVNLLNVILFYFLLKRISGFPSLLSLGLWLLSCCC